MTKTDHRLVVSKLNLKHSASSATSNQESSKETGCFKGSPISKALTCMKILSRRPILLAILLYEQFIHLIHINLHSNIQFLSTQQNAYQFIFWLLPGLISFASLLRAVRISEKNIYMNMNCNYSTTMYESMFAQIHIFMVEK